MRLILIDLDHTAFLYKRGIINYELLERINALYQPDNMVIFVTARTTQYYVENLLPSLVTTSTDGDLVPTKVITAMLDAEHYSWRSSLMHSLMDIYSKSEGRSILVSTPYDHCLKLDISEGFETFIADHEAKLLAGNLTRDDYHELDRKIIRQIRDDNKYNQLAYLLNTLIKRGELENLREIYYFDDKEANLSSFVRLTNKFKMENRLTKDIQINSFVVTEPELTKGIEVMPSTVALYHNPLLVLHLHNGAISGANLTAQNILSHMAHYPALVYSMKDGPVLSRPEKLGYEVHTYLEGKKLFARINAYKSFMKDELETMIFIANSIMSWPIVVELKHQNMGVKVIWLLHEAYHLEPGQSSLSHTPNERLCKENFHQVTEALKLADQVVTVCEYQKQLYQPYCEPTVIYNGTDFIQWKDRLDQVKMNDIENFRNRYDIEKTDLVILTLGTVCPRKNQLSIVEMATKLKERGIHNVKFFLVGVREGRKEEERYVERIKKAIHEKGLQDRVILVDQTKEPAIYYKAADIFCFPSNNEALSQVVIEAAYSELAIVSTNVAGMTEILKHDESCFYHDPADIDSFVDSLARFIEFPDLRRVFSSNAKEEVEGKFSREISGKNYLSLFDTLTFVDDTSCGYDSSTSEEDSESTCSSHQDSIDIERKISLGKEMITVLKRDIARLKGEALNSIDRQAELSMTVSTKHDLEQDILSLEQSLNDMKSCDSSSSTASMSMDPGYSLFHSTSKVRYTESYSSLVSSLVQKSKPSDSTWSIEETSSDDEIVTIPNFASN